MRKWLGLVLALTLVTACDMQQFHFTNSIPLRGMKGPADVYVYIGLDGLSHNTATEVMRRGRFAGGYQLAKFITMFPGTSDASWTRIMHTKALPGYEYEYYDPKKDVLENTGIIGILRHVFPPITEGLSVEPEYYKAFDYRGNGYLHGITGYSQPFMSAYESLDSMFISLEGRSRTNDTYSAYMLETDMLGHSEADPLMLVRFLEMIDKRIERIKEMHPDQRFHVTIFSDHGIDFVPIVDPMPVVFEDELAKVGIESVTTLAGRSPDKLFALSIRHTRVTYVEMHTHPSLIQQVAKISATIPAVDITVTRVPAQSADPSFAAVDWYGVYGKVAIGADRVLTFGFDKNTNKYLIATGTDTTRFNFVLAGGTAVAAGYTAYTDEELFTLSKHSMYPDLLFRIRTSLTAIGVEYPADILVSLKEGFPSMGNAVLGGIKDVARAGFHGALRAPGTLGTLLTNERTIPDAVRSDVLLTMFPKLKQHLERRGVTIYPGDQYATSFSR